MQETNLSRENLGIIFTTSDRQKTKWVSDLCISLLVYSYILIMEILDQKPR